MDSIGKHVLADLYGVNPKLLQDEHGLMALLESSLKKHEFHIVDRLSYKFSGGGNGVTGIFLLSESHASFHTYPETFFVALDLFSCGSKDPEIVLNELIAKLKPLRIWKSLNTRGAEHSQLIVTVH